MTALFLYTLFVGTLFENLLPFLLPIWNAIPYLILFFIVFIIIGYIYDYLKIDEQSRGLITFAFIVIGAILLAVIDVIANFFGF